MLRRWLPLTLLLALCFTLTHSSRRGAERWMAPLPSAAVVRGFDFDARTPFATVPIAGQFAEPRQTVLRVRRSPLRDKDSRRRTRAVAALRADSRRPSWGWSTCVCDVAASQSPVRRSGPSAGAAGCGSARASCPRAGDTGSARADQRTGRTSACAAPPRPRCAARPAGAAATARERNSVRQLQLARLRDGASRGRTISGKFFGTTLHSDESRRSRARRTISRREQAGVDVPGRSFYVTTPIYYVNTTPHLGHAYTTIAADVSRAATGDAGRLLPHPHTTASRVSSGDKHEGVTPGGLADPPDCSACRRWRRAQRRRLLHAAEQPRRIAKIQVAARVKDNGGAGVEHVRGWSLPRRELKTSADRRATPADPRCRWSWKPGGVRLSAFQSR